MALLIVSLSFEQGCRARIPVDSGDDAALGKWSRLLGLLEYTTGVFDVVWRVYCMVDSHDDEESP